MALILTNLLRATDGLSVRPFRSSVTISRYRHGHYYEPLARMFIAASKALNE
jgi:hypothetical protein